MRKVNVLEYVHLGLRHRKAPFFVKYLMGKRILAQAEGNSLPESLAILSELMLTPRLYLSASSVACLPIA
jgi:hypothetical protein